MVGLRQLATRSPPIAVKSLENMSMKVFGCISLMSAPAAKAFSPPASTMHPIPSSASRSSTAAAISLNTPKDSALSSFGRFSVMMPTAPLLSTMMCSNVLMTHPAADFAGNVPAGGMGFKWVCETTSRHEHARGGGHRQQRAEADEDFPDQGGLVPGGAFVAAGCRHRCGRCLSRGHRQAWRGSRGFLQRAIDIVELIGGDDLGVSGRLRVG